MSENFVRREVHRIISEYGLMAYILSNVSGTLGA